GNHGHSAEGNPSGGNNFRGLYNIAIKSIGAARKKHPDVRLDYVIDYGEPMTEPGYYFMDSPGNDLESIAGQVASGCNAILFTTGNGSITNFPFVPTLKIVTTTPRFNMLAHEMDVNAGRYQDGCPMDELGAETFELMLNVCGGQACLGEKAGHSQVAIWRNWAQADGSRIQRILNAPQPGGRPLPVNTLAGPLPATRFQGIRTARGVASDRVGLIVPTSICSGEVARQIAAKLNEKRGRGGGSAEAGGVSRYVALVHTEGCGSAGSDSLFLRTLLGHIVHPSVHKGLLLEHGCEKTHNDAVRHFLKEQGVDDRQFGWASIQMDGGIERATDKVERWFAQPSRDRGEPASAGLEHVRVALTATGDIGNGLARGFARLAQAVATGGGLVVVPQNAGLLRSKAFREALLAAPDEAEASLAYGQPAPEAGLHVMESPTDHSGETLTGLGATGVEVMLAHVYGPPLQSHPMIPLVQVSGEARTVKRFGKDLDLVLDANAAPEAVAAQLLETLCQVLSRQYTPRMFAQGNTDFQMTRGLLGVSM
ncbi:MAG: UxaA family hydrolase, partial [SAR324 cluster bacterium]